MKKFCVLTTGRTASTALMQVLEGHEDILVPNKITECPSNELLPPNRPPRNQESANAFYRLGGRYAYAGFKSIPKRHLDFDQFILRSDIQFITLIPKDVLATVASFMAANESGDWERTGGKVKRPWYFKDHHKPQVSKCLANVQKTNRLLSQVPGAIALLYEDLCTPDYQNPALNTFFGREIKLESPRQPTTIHVSNWEEYQQFCNQ